MQQSETQLLYWAPSRVRFNLTLILAAVVTLLGVLQFVGIDPISALCSPARETANTAPAQQGGPAAGEAEAPAAPSRTGNAWLLIVVGLAVGAYSWLTSPRQYRVYSDALIIMFGTPRRRTIHFSDIRELANDRGFMGDPLRVYTMNRRRIPIQVQEPEPMHQALQSALAEFRRAYPQYAPPPAEESEGTEAADATAGGDATRAEGAPPAAEGAGSSSDGGEAPDGGAPPRNRASRRRSLRDDSYDGGEGDDSRPRFS